MKDRLNEARETWVAVNSVTLAEATPRPRYMASSPRSVFQARAFVNDEQTYFATVIREVQRKRKMRPDVGGIKSFECQTVRFEESANVV